MKEHMFDSKNFKHLCTRSNNIIKINSDDSRELAIQVIDMLIKSCLVNENLKEDIEHKN